MTRKQHSELASELIATRRRQHAPGKQGAQVYTFCDCEKKKPLARQLLRHQANFHANFRCARAHICAHIADACTRFFCFFLHLLVVLLCLRKLARARARRRILSVFFSKDRRGRRHAVLSHLPRRYTPLFVLFMRDGGKVFGRDSCKMVLGSQLRRYIKVLCHFSTLTSIAIDGA